MVALRGGLRGRILDQERRLLVLVSRLGDVPPGRAAVHQDERRVRVGRAESSNSRVEASQSRAACSAGAASSMLGQRPARETDLRRGRLENR